jgi:L-methionine (R)-S-oxide reductase
VLSRYGTLICSLHTAGHIACDSASKSEIVVPLVISRSKQLSKHHQGALRGSAPAGNLNGSSAQDAAEAPSEGRATKSQKQEIPVEWQGRGEEDEIIIGVLDIDCEEEEGFDKDDEEGLTAIAKLIADACDW